MLYNETYFSVVLSLALWVDAKYIPFDAGVLDLRKAVWPYNSQPQSYKSILNLAWSAKKAAQYMVQTGLLGQFLEARNRPTESLSVADTSYATLAEDGQYQGENVYR